MQDARIGRRAHRVAQSLVAEHLRELGENLQVLFGRLLRNEQHEDQRHRMAVGRIERYWLGEAEQPAERVLEALDAAVGYRDASSESGGGKALASKQAVEHLAARDPVEVLEEQPRLLEKPLFARHLQIDGDMARGKQFGDETHSENCIRTPDP